MVAVLEVKVVFDEHAAEIVLGEMTLQNSGVKAMGVALEKSLPHPARWIIIEPGSCSADGAEVIDASCRRDSSSQLLYIIRFESKS